MWIVLATQLFACNMADMQSTQAKAGDADPVIFGTVTRFAIAPAEITPRDAVAITLRIRNIRSVPVTFRYSGCIQEHIDVFDARGRLIPWKPGAPTPECAYREIALQPGATVQRKARFEIGKYYSLAPGLYVMRFKYDRRLMESNLLSEPWTPWANTEFKLVVKESR